MNALDGYWIPSKLKDMLLSQAKWQTYWLKNGEVFDEPILDAVPVKYPQLDIEQITVLLESLNSFRSIKSNEVLGRWQSAIEKTKNTFLSRGNDIIPLLVRATGYSTEMFYNALGRGDLADPSEIEKALNFKLLRTNLNQWFSIPELPGKVKFFPAKNFDRYRLKLMPAQPFFHPTSHVDMVLGYAAGNIPGSSFLLALLGSISNFHAHDKKEVPSIVIRNSRHEPIFTPWILSIIEEFDPELLSNLAILLWDYEDSSLQKLFMTRADLMIAAAGDDTIASLEKERTAYSPETRFHSHGHKASFAIIDETYIDSDQFPGDNCLIETIPLLAALDSILWDQNGCLSARIHFVVGDEARYANKLLAAMRSLSNKIPRGTTPMRFVHRTFDYYHALPDQTTVNIISSYDDDFAIIVDKRDLSELSFQQAVNNCMGRTIIIKPIKLSYDAVNYIKNIPSHNLQSISLAVNQDELYELADALAKAGVTSIRSLGRAAFPRLSHSWDGYLPLDLCLSRPKGHFSTIEFDDLYEEISDSASFWQFD